MLFCQQTHKMHSYYHLVTAESLFFCTRIRHMHQKKPRKGVCYHTFIIFQVRHDVGRCVRSGSCSLSSLKSQWTVLVRYLTISTKWMLAVIKNVVDDNIIYLSATLLMHAPAHGARKTVQQLLHKTLNFIYPALWSQQAQAEINWLQDLRSLQQCEYQLQVNKIEEIKQRSVELWKSSNTTFEWKHAIFVFLCYPR